MRFKLLIISLLISMTCLCQNIKKHQWENRVLLIYAEDLDSELVKQQLQKFSGKKEALQERKLVIYTISKDSFGVGVNSIKRQIRTKKLNKFKLKKEFKVLLLGLDGGIKLQQKEILSSQKLFAIIDGMPMRRREIRRGN